MPTTQVYKVNYENFEKEVKMCPYYDADWGHILPGVPMQHRQRFVDVISKGVRMPDAFDLVLVSSKMTDEAFYKKLNERYPEQ